jgi:hypothetical protein
VRERRGVPFETIATSTNDPLFSVAHVDDLARDAECFQHGLGTENSLRRRLVRRERFVRSFRVMTELVGRR